MTTIKAADELRAAAKLMRERAEAATPGPWTTTEAHGRDIADEGWSDVRVRALGHDVAITYMTGVLEGDPHEDNAPYIAGMSPPVALAVADWLDRFADPVYCYGPVEYAAALNIARAYLGTSGDALAEVAGTFTEQEG